MTVFIQYLVNGLSMGSVYAIIALGYTMVYGIAKMLNFAHGDVIMVGAYVSFCATSYLGLPGWASVVLSCVVCTVLGVLIEGLAYKPLRQAGPLAVLITAIGVSYFLQNAAQLLWGATPKNFTSLVTFQVPEFLAKFNVSAVSLVTIVACLVIMAGLMFFTGKTKMGKAMRAVSEDKAARSAHGHQRQPHHLDDVCHRLGACRHRPACSCAPTRRCCSPRRVPCLASRPSTPPSSAASAPSPVPLSVAFSSASSRRWRRLTFPRALPTPSSLVF